MDHSTLNPPHLQGRAPFAAGMPGGDANSGLRAQSTPANYAEQQQQVCIGNATGRVEWDARLEVSPGQLACAETQLVYTY